MDAGGWMLDGKFVNPVIFKVSELEIIMDCLKVTRLF